MAKIRVGMSEKVKGGRQDPKGRAVDADGMKAILGARAHTHRASLGSSRRGRSNVVFRTSYTDITADEEPDGKERRRRGVSHRSRLQLNSDR